MNSIKRNMLLNCIRTGISTLFPFLVFQYASRIIQAENLGRVNFSNSIINYFILFAGLGISSYAIRESGKYTGNKKAFIDFASEMFSINIISTILSCALLVIISFSVSKFHSYHLLIFIQSLCVISTAFGMEWINIVYEDYLYITVRTLFFQILTLVLTVLFVKNIEDYYLFAIITVVGKIGPDILNWIYIRRKYFRVKFGFGEGWKNHLKPIFIIFINSLVISIYVNVDTTMIGFFKDDTQVGYYTVAVKIYTAMKTIFSAIISVTVSRISIYLASGEQEKVKELIGRMANCFMEIIIPLILFVMLMSENIIGVLFGDSYLEAVLPLQVLCVGVLFSVFASVMTNCILLPMGLERYALLATTISAITNVVLNIWFIQKLGIVGAALTTVSAEFVVLLIVYIIIRIKKVFSVSLFAVKSFCKALGICFVVCISLYILSGFFEEQVLEILVGGLVLCFCYAICYRNEIKHFIKRLEKK